MLIEVKAEVMKRMSKQHHEATTLIAEGRHRGVLYALLRGKLTGTVVRSNTRLVTQALPTEGALVPTVYLKK